MNMDARTSTEALADLRRRADQLDRLAEEYGSGRLSILAHNLRADADNLATDVSLEPGAENMDRNEYAVRIEYDNDAFGEQPGYETARILRTLADKLDATGTLPKETHLTDANGNTVGRAIRLDA